MFIALGGPTKVARLACSGSSDRRLDNGVASISKFMIFSPLGASKQLVDVVFVHLAENLGVDDALVKDKADLEAVSMRNHCN